MRGEPRWQAVLYGRTRRADRWWRVRPHDIDVSWLNALVLAGTGGGEGLAEQPRFLLARHEQVVLVGVACRAALLSDTMNSDGSRPLYCFVGWLSNDEGAPVPQLEALEEQWLPWATGVYEAWMPLDWDKHPTDLADAHEPPLESPPWPAESTVPAPADLASSRESSPATARRGPLVFPVEARVVAWRQLYVTPGDFVFAVGLRTSFPDANGVLTHLAMAAYAGETQAGSRVQPADNSPEPVDAGPPPDVPVHTGNPPAGRPASDRVLPRSSPDSPPPAGPAPRQVADHRAQPPVETQRSAPRGSGVLRRVGQALRSLTVGSETTPEPEADGPPVGPPTPPTAPTAGPARDLAYWQQVEAQTPPPSPHKRVPHGPQKPMPPQDPHKQVPPDEDAH
jgi:hypothetical protein